MTCIVGLISNDLNSFYFRDGTITYKDGDGYGESEISMRDLYEVFKQRLLKDPDLHKCIKKTSQESSYVNR